MKVIVAGSRKFYDYMQLMTVLIDMLEFDLIDEIVSGGAEGADYLGETFARECEIDLKIFHADWKKHGKSAGPRRNRKMAEYADCLIAFWDGKSPGTKNMIEEAEKKGLKIVIVPPREKDI